MTIGRIMAVAGVLFSASALAASSDEWASKPANAATQAEQARFRATLPADDGQDAEFAKRGFIATAKEPIIRAADGRIVWDMSELDWISGDAPPTVNPSLWRQMKLLKTHGLFKLTDGVWQVRGFDASNMLVVRGKTGWIIADPLMTVETAKVALAFVNEQLGKRPVTGVIYTHSHPDHFGGVRALVAPGTKPPIVAPALLVDEAVAENVLAGNAMSRRAVYQFGYSLKPGPQGFVGGGIVTDAAKNGTVSLLPPTDHIHKTGETRVIDGVKFEFQMVPETEAPSEMNFFLPAQKTLYISEIATCTMHNVQTPRGALVRDANGWAGYLTEMLRLYADRSEALATGHCWPRFGNEVISNYIRLQRDNYKFIHDQTVRRMNEGQTPNEIAAELKLPDAVANEWSNRGYYGTVKHNARGVYQRYIGWWDGIPASLDRYPRAEEAKRYVAAIGGVDKVIAQAKTAQSQGDDRWAAELLSHVMFVDPEQRKARAMLADSYEQLGYRAESAIWRNIYLTGAAELRGTAPTHMSLASPDLIAAMPTKAFLDLLAARLNPDKIGTRTMTVVLEASDRNERSLLSLANAVLVGEPGQTLATPTVRVSGPQAMLAGLFLKKLPFDALESKGLKISGDRAALAALQAAIEAPQADYSIVTP